MRVICRASSGLHQNISFLDYKYFNMEERFKKPINRLIEEGRKFGIEFTTYEKVGTLEADVYLFWDCPKMNDDVYIYAKQQNKKRVLLAFEPSFFIPENTTDELSQMFDQIYTWERSTWDEKKYFCIRPIYFSLEERRNAEKKKLCSMVSTIYPNFSNANSLYRKRKDIIQWYEKNACEELDFYGKKNRYSDNCFSLYKGTVLDKLDVIAKYRFNYCLENHKTPYKYITEKIFDCFMASTVPIYSGCENISTYISREAYILLDDFTTMESLHSYLKRMSKEEYEQYLSAGQRVNFGNSQ